MVAGRTASAIAGSVERAIGEGRLGPGGLLPPVRGLAAALGVSPATVAAGYRLLAVRGLAVGEGRRGTRIAPRPALALPTPASVAPPGTIDLAEGNPDPHRLPALRAALAGVPSAPGLYGRASVLPRLRDVATRAFTADGIPARHLAALGGALDAVERVLQGHLRPGDRVAVEDPGYAGVLDLLAALGLVAVPVAIDDSGPLPDAVEEAFGAGAAAFVVTPRAQNPTGAALDEARARRLRQLLDRHPEVLVIEDDHAGPVSGVPTYTTVHDRRPRWAVIRSVSKWLGPDLRVAVMSGDATTVARVQGRQALGAGWVSHILQEAVAHLWADPATRRRVEAAARAYSLRRDALVHALRREGLSAHGRSGLNVWIPVREEAALVTAMAAAGWAVRAGERYRIRSGPAVRVTISGLHPTDAPRVARALAAAQGGPGATRSD
jgi:DNA-binding transcriptional MocR family regulator